MALKDIFKVSGKTFFNPAGWLGYNQVKNNTNIIWSILQDLIVPAQAKHKETFAEAMKRLNLDEQEITDRKETYFNYVLFFIAMASVLIIYSFYLLIVHRTFSGFALGLVSSALFGVQAFKYHFWYTQIKLRRLGLTYHDWLKTITGATPGSNP
jgi:intracellular multiplication protein IcmV